MYNGALLFCIKNLSKSERYVKINLCIVMAYIVGYRQHSFTEQEKIIMGFVIENGVLIKYTEEPGVTEVVIPDGVTSIGNWFFWNCRNLTSVVILDCVTSIGFSLFSGCERLFSLTIGSGLESIDFLSDSFLTEINISPDNRYLTSIDNVVYNKDSTVLIKCASMKPGVLHIPEGVKCIASRAFLNCKSLTALFIPDSVTEIQENAFEDCSGLVSLSIGSGLQSLNEIPFSILEEITISPDNPWYASTENVVYQKKSLKLINCAGRKKGELRVPDGVTSIGPSAFKDCSELTSIILPDSVDSIGKDAFKGCHAFHVENGIFIRDHTLHLYTGATMKVTIPDGVKKIADYAFLGCETLFYLIVSDTVERIGEGAFQNCRNMERVDLGSGIKRIGKAAFSGCRSLLLRYRNLRSDRDRKPRFCFLFSALLHNIFKRC